MDIPRYSYNTYYNWRLFYGHSRSKEGLMDLTTEACSCDSCNYWRARELERKEEVRKSKENPELSEEYKQKLQAVMKKAKVERPNPFYTKRVFDLPPPELNENILLKNIYKPYTSEGSPEVKDYLKQAQDEVIKVAQQAYDRTYGPGDPYPTTPRPKSIEDVVEMWEQQDEEKEAMMNFFLGMVVGVIGTFAIIAGGATVYTDWKKSVDSFVQQCSEAGGKHAIYDSRECYTELGNRIFFEEAK